MQAAAAKEKQDTKAMDSFLDNRKTVWSLVNNNEQVDQDKSEHKKILSRAYLANIITKGKNLPTSFSSTTVTVIPPTTTETTPAVHSLPSSSLWSTIIVTSTIMTESPYSLQVIDNEVVVSVNPLSTSIRRWSNTLKQFVDKLPTNCLSV